MKTASPFIVEGHNLSNTWLQGLRTICDGPGTEITPLVISITDFEESDKIREGLDLSLKANGKSPIRTVAETIFPSSQYILCDFDRDALYEEYKANLPRLMAVEPVKNGKGTYFGRLINYDGKNQLEIIISSYLNTNGPRRRSKMQASIFDPRTDHTDSPYLGFPCLQHVTCYVHEQEGLILNSFYAVQSLYVKAYGNWLGLIELGKFLAREMDLKFGRLNCFVGVEKLEKMTKENAKALLKALC